jgi:hypothetical protein
MARCVLFGIEPLSCGMLYRLFFVVLVLQTMAAESNPNPLPICPLCGEPCPLENCVTDSRGQAVHEECYRAAVIEGREELLK